MKEKLLQARNIIQGWFYASTQPDNLKSEAQKRATICMDCDQFDAETIKCKDCGCPVGKKIWAPNDECPRNKWGKMKV